MNIGDTFKKIMDSTSEIETNLGNPMACFLERQEREEKEKKAHSNEIKAKGKNK